MHSCFTSSIFAARTLDFEVKFGFVFRSEAVVFRRYVLALVYLSLIGRYFPQCFLFFSKNSSILLRCCYDFAFSSPVFPRKLVTCAVVYHLCRPLTGPDNFSMRRNTRSDWLRIQNTLLMVRKSGQAS